MSVHTLARALFAPPGAPLAHTRHLLAQAAGSHARLLGSTASAHSRSLDRLREPLDAYLHSSAPAAEKQLVLDDPQFVEALHALAGTSIELAGWDAVLSGEFHEIGDCHTPLARGRLGNVVAAVRLHRHRQWQGEIELATDGYGRIHLPFSDWTLVLVNDGPQGREPFGNEPVVLHVDEREAFWSLSGRRGDLLARMPRALFDAMMIDNQDVACAHGLEFGAGPPRARFERASRLGATRIRFEPISADAPTTHAELTGAIVGALVAAIARHAPRIHGQLCQSIRTIHGFELPDYGCGQIASFSLPTSPGVIGFNVAYTAADEPRVSPYCFMWLGHELGHTLNYLISDVAFTHGWRFLENPGEATPVIPRYGRSVKVRTLFQIPYVHLFEWWLLMLFEKGRFAGLPWRSFDDAGAVGDDLRDEIAESFELIDQHARLTLLGHAAVARFRELADEADSHWRKLRGRSRRRAS